MLNDKKPKRSRSRLSNKNARDKKDDKLKNSWSDTHVKWSEDMEKMTLA